MAINLFDLIENLNQEINPPGSSLFPDATDDQLEISLINAFWELVLGGYISGFTEELGVVTEDTDTPTEDLPREQQQLIVLQASMNIIRLKLIDLDTMFRTQAGPVEYEVRKSAQTLESVLKNFQRRFDDVVSTLPNTNVAGSVVYADIVSLRSDVVPGYSTFIGY